MYRVPYPPWGHRLIDLGKLRHEACFMYGVPGKGWGQKETHNGPSH